MTNELQQKIEQIYGLELVGERFDLTLTEKLLELLDNPHLKYDTIQITGTNGKGSTARYLQALLQREGTKIGMYTSPHVFYYNERFDVNGEPITNRKLAKLIDEIMLVCEENDIKPTFFEFTTALAFTYFANQGCELAVIEMGLGSALDSTNCIKPIVSVITNVGIDHTALLGHTKMEIAKNKACCIKEGTSFVTGVAEEEIAAYFQSECDKLDIPYVHTREYDTVFVPQVSSDGVIRKIKWSDKVIKLQSIVPYQLENMQTALVAAERSEYPYDVSRLEKVHVIGRHDIFYPSCPVLIDGAHNEMGFEALADAIQKEPVLSMDAATLIIAISDEGKIVSLEKLSELFSRVILTEGSHKVFDADAVLAKVSQKSKFTVIKDATAAYESALAESPSCIVVTGSLYMIPTILQKLRETL